MHRLSNRGQISMKIFGPKGSILGGIQHSPVRLQISPSESWSRSFMRRTLPIMSMTVEHLCQFWIGTLAFRLSVFGRRQHAIQRVEKGKRIVKLPIRPLTKDKAIAWLVEAALRYQGKAVSLAALQSLPVIYPFAMKQPLGYLMSNSPMLEVRAEGPSNQLVALREKN